MRRREFMACGAGGLAAILGAGSAGATRGGLPGLPMAPLGDTGLRTSVLGLGTGTRAWGGDSAQKRRGDKAFVNLIEHAYTRGVRYFDLADMYGSHEYMRRALAGTVDRDKALLLTKTVSRDAAGVASDIERFRQEIDTDVLDVVLLHCLTDPEWPSKVAPCMDALTTAKSKGSVRACGVSCHNMEALERAAGEPWVDVILARVNPRGVKMDGPVDRVVKALRTAAGNGKGVVGMKVLGEGSLADQAPDSIRFVLGLDCVHAITVGCLDTAELDETARLSREASSGGIGSG